MPSRREFLKWIAAAGGAFAFHTHLPAFARPKKKIPVDRWRGNSPGFCHHFLKDGGAVPNVLPEFETQVCIVGGGLSGLSAAYTLRDIPFILLEGLGNTGGHAVRDKWGDIYYSGGAAYFVAPEAPLDKLYEEIGLPLMKIQEPVDSLITGSHKLRDPFEADAALARVKKDLVKILNGDDCPVMPISETSEASKKYDRITFADWLIKEKRYPIQVKRLVDLYCRSAFGAPSSEAVSAFAGLNFYASEFGDRYTCPGGTALAAELLREKIDRAGRGRIIPNSTVISVEMKGGRAVTTYIDNRGDVKAVASKAVIMAVPKFIAARIVRGLPQDQLKAIAGLRFGSHLVANVLCESAIAGDSYDTWIDDAPFTDFIVADWITRDGDRRSKRQVLTVYYPICYDHSALLDDLAYGKFQSRIIDWFEKFYPGAKSKIEDVVLYRWGHAQCHALPGWYTKMSLLAGRTFGRIVFAHSDNQGLPAFESALIEGMQAAKKVLMTLPKETL